MIRDYGDSVEADFADAGVSLAELFRAGNDMTVRKAWVLIRQRAYGSRLTQAAEAEIQKAQADAERQVHLSRAARYKH